MSNLLVKHGRTFSPAKLRNQSRIERSPPRNSVRVKNKGLNRLRKEHDRKRFVFSMFLDSSDEKPGPSYATAVRGLERYCTARSLQLRKGATWG
jgi:hypothetical protein